MPIPPWWPAEERRNFIVEMAGQAACSAATELDDIVDRATDRACPTQSGDALAAAISAEQHVLLAEYCTTVVYDLSQAIADKSAELTTEAVFTHARRRRRAQPLR